MNEKRNAALDRYPIEKRNTGRPSVTVKEDGTVIFYLYASAAKKVQVAGLGGYFTNEKIDLGCTIISGMWTVSGSAIRAPEFPMGALLRSILLRYLRREWISTLQRKFPMVRSASVNTSRR